jgi:hypothetical protein
MNRPTEFSTRRATAQVSLDGDNATQSGSKPLLMLFWAYVTIPLVWGVVNTLLQASKLFQ